MTATIVQEFYRGAKVVRIRSGASWLASCVDLTLRNTRRYGGYIVHLGMVMIFIGLAGQAFNKEVEKEVPIGSTVSIGKYELLLQSMDQKQEKNYVADRMIVEVMKDQKPVMMLYPERRNFPTNQESGTMVAIYSTLKEDLYVVYAGMNPANQSADAACVHQSAGEVGMVGRHGGGDGHDRCAGAESRGSSGAGADRSTCRRARK